MKWVFYVIIFIYMFYRTVYGKMSTTIDKESHAISIDPINYDQNKPYFEAGKQITIACKREFASKVEKMEWVNPDGVVVQRDIQNRVFAQEYFVTSYKTRELRLVMKHAKEEDTGVWECRSGNAKAIVSICVIEPSTFIDTDTEVTIDRGRAITLSCQARGEPEPRLLWYSNNGEIITDDPNSSKYKLMTTYHSQGFTRLLTIMSLESEDSGEYRCEAIQDSPRNNECSESQIKTVTLHVNYPPKFADDNKIALVPGQENKRLDLVCVADAYPVPTYRWFKEVGDVLSEYPKDDILLENNGTEAVLTLTANSFKFGDHFQCRANNQYGEANKAFSLIRLQLPKLPDEIILNNVNDDTLDFYVTWKGNVSVDNMIVQYLKKSLLNKKSKPGETDWRKANKSNITIEEDLINKKTADINVVLEKLDEDTDYWVRMRAVNKAGTSPWSTTISASTLSRSKVEANIKEEEEDEENEKKEGEKVEEEVVESDKPTPAALTDSTFYGVFFAGGIIVIAVGCMFFMRMV